MPVSVNNTARRGRVENKVALVTGAARGIGRVTAELLARDGAYVVVTDVRDEEGVTVAERIGRPATYQHLDVRCEAEWEKVLSFVEAASGGWTS